MKSTIESSRRCCDALVLGALGLFSGCAVGPDYRTPSTIVGASFTQAPVDAVTGDGAALAAWWRKFDDPFLTELVDHAIAQNHDLRRAAARLTEVRAFRRLSTLDRFPTVQAGAGYTEGLASGPVGTPREAREYERVELGFDASWEIDLFGRVRRAVEAANAGLAAAEAARLDVFVSLTAEVARDYFELRGLQSRLVVARKNAELQTETLKLTQALLDGGRGNEFDVTRSRSLLNLTRSEVPALEGAVRKSIHRLAVLTGRPPEALVVVLSDPRPLPAVVPALMLVSPESMLRRRPDIRAAESALAADTALVGVATADLFPRVTLFAGIGLQADALDAVGDRGSDTWSFGPQIRWAAFDLGRVRARVKAANARAEAALAVYEQTVLRALEETENALVDHRQENVRRQFLLASAAASKQAVDLVHARYEAGATDFISVLDAERTLLEAQDRLVASETRCATAVVAIFKALGGGLPVDAAL